MNKKIAIKRGDLEFVFNINENNNILGKDNTEVNILFLIYSLENKILNENLSEVELREVKLLKDVIIELKDIVEEV